MGELLSLAELRQLPIEELLKRPTAELQMLMSAEETGDEASGRLPFKIDMARNKALDMPSYYATEIVDPYYKQNFERIHYIFMDEVAAPYLLGESFKLDGITYDPKDYVGFIVEFSRDTFKSSMMRLLADWKFKYTKIRENRDDRQMYVHQVLDKAIKAGEAIRATAKMNRRARECFPEFRGIQGEWDTKQEWRWPCFTAFQAGEFSFTAYGETSDKTGGHYTTRFVDDWETEKSVTNTTQLDASVHNFRAMDPLRDRTVSFCPYLIAGTTYHHQGLYKTLEKDGGYLIWKVPAHKGSPKALFDLCGLDPRKRTDKLKIEAGIRKLERDRKDDLNFPQRLPWRELYLSARGQSPRIFNCQMLLNPTPEGDARFDLEALDEAWVTDIPTPLEMWIYIRCDPAISEKKDADETAILVGGVSWDAKRWLLDGWVGREKQPNKIVLRTFDFAEKWKSKGYRVVNIGYEEVAFQAALKQMAKYGVGERAAVHDGESVPMRTKPCAVRGITRTSERTKHERILEMDGPITRREIKFWKKCRVAERVMTQFRNFPFDKDDCLDAMHDFWEATQTPPPPEHGATPRIPVEFQKAIAMQRAQLEGRLTGTHNSVTLVGGWN